MIGTRVSHYRITGRLGEGGMGVVYEALDEMLDRAVAIKFPSRALVSTDALANEAKAASRLNHPNVAQVYEFGQLPDGSAFIAMELIRGQTLRDRLASGPLPLPEALRVIRDVAQALNEAHEHGIVHLDIKTGNIAITDRGVVKVLDFGLAQLRPTAHADADDDTTATLSGDWRGTPSYMSPEQAQAFAVDRRSDLFSLGAVMYECLTGQRPFVGQTKQSTLVAVVSHHPPPPSTVASAVPKALDAVVMKLLAKEPKDRYRSVTEFLEDLHRVTTTPRPAPSRSRWPWVAAAVAVIALAGWLTTKWWNARVDPGPLVVLSFENRTGEPAQDAFCQGVTEVATSLLISAEFPDAATWVAPASDVSRLGVRTAVDARRVFGATGVVTGAIRRASDGYDIVVTLVRASDQARVRSRDVHVASSETPELEARLATALSSVVGLRSAPLRVRKLSTALASANFLDGRGRLHDWEKGDNLAEAVRLLESSVREQPDYVPANLDLSQAYLRTYTRTHDRTWLAKADQAARHALDVDAKDPDVHVQVARILRQTGQYDEAIHEAQTALDRDPKNLNAMLQMAIVYELMRRPADAETLYQKAISLRPSYLPAYANLGILYMSQGQYAKALDPLSLVASLLPDQADAHTNLGTAFYYLNRLGDAEREFTRSIEIRPNTQAYANRCGVAFELTHLDLAVGDCRRALDLDPGNPFAYGNLADALAARPADRAEADATYRKAIDAGNRRLAVNPQDPDLLASLALFASKIGQRSAAHQFAEQALRTGAERVGVLYKTAKAYGLTGECAKAADGVAQALRKGYSRDIAGRDPDLNRFQSGSHPCEVPSIK